MIPKGAILAVTGGTGFVGKTTVALARKAGINVRALTRRPQKKTPGISWVEGSLSDAASLRRLCDGAHAVLHIAGVVNAPDRKGFETGNIAGTLAVVDAAKAMNVQRFIHVSSLAAREPELSNYGWSKARAEKIVGASGLDWTIVRPPGIYGPGDSEMLDLFKMAKRGVVLLPPKGRVSLLHVNDLGRLLLSALPSNEDTTSQIFDADDGADNGWSHAEFAKMLGSAVGQKVMPLHAPGFMLKIASRMEGWLRGDKAKLTADRVNYLCHEDWTIDTSKRPPETLWTPEIATSKGLKHTAEWYKQSGWL